MENDPIKDVPDDHEIEQMLSQFSPQPTPRFFSKMSSPPWQRRIRLRAARSSNKFTQGSKLIWGMAVLVLALVILVIMFIPSVRVAASQLIHLFLPEPSNQLAVQVPLTSPGDMVYFSDPANFPLSVKDAQQLAAFGLKEISTLPEGLIFVGARYDPSYKAVTLLYVAGDYKLFLTQRLLGNTKDVFSIGASAIVKNVSIGDLPAEFVTGGWEAVSTQPAPENPPSTTSVNINAVWDNALPQSTLRWQAGDIVFELRSDGEGSPSQSELINLANGLK